MLIVTNRTGSAQSVGSRIIAPNSSATFTDAEVAAPGFSAQLDALRAAGVVTSTISSVGVENFSGTGPFTLAPTTVIAYVNPGGGAATVLLASVASAGVGQEVTIVQQGTGTTAILPSGTDLLYAGSSVYTLSARNDSLSVRSDLATNAWRFSARVGAPQTFLVYVSTTGSDTNPGTQALPLLTYDEALARADLSQWRTTGIAQFGAGSFTASRTEVPGGFGSQATPLELRGTQTQVDSGTINTCTAADLLTSNPTTFTLTGTPWTASAFRGNVIRFTATNQQYGLSDNTTSGGTCMDFTGGSGNSGSAYTVWANQTTISYPTNTEVSQGSGESIKFTQLNVAAPGNLSFLGVALIEAEVVWQLSPSSSVRFRHDSVCTHAGDINITVGLGYAFQHYIDLASGSATFAMTGGRVLRSTIRNATFTVQEEAPTLISGGSADLSSTIPIGTASLRMYGGFSINQGFYSSSASPGTQGLIAVLGNSRGIVNVARADSCANPVLRVSDGARVTVTRLLGTNNSGPPVVTLSGGSITVTDANTVTNISAASGNPVQVGGKVALSTWAQIQAGASADCTDLAAANPQLCYVGPT